jgi:hypothetical protein
MRNALKKSGDGEERGGEGREGGEEEGGGRGLGT